MVNRLIASIAMSCAVVAAGSALAQDLPKQAFNVLARVQLPTGNRTSNRLDQTVPRASKGQISPNHR